MFKTTTLVAACLTLIAAIATSAFAQNPSAISGTWESLDSEKGELYRLDLGEDGVVSLEIYNIEFGFLALDEEKHLMAIYGDEEELENPDSLDWIEYRVQGNKLTIIASPEETVVLDRIDRPEKANNALIGSWQLNVEESALEIDEDEAQMVLNFHNDGTASYQEPNELLAGTYSVDAEMGTISITIEDELKEGTYQITAGKLSITIEDETKVFERVE